MFVDSHAHLDGKQFDSDRDAVIARAREAGVQTMVAIGNGDGPPQLDAGVKLAEQYPFMYATVGVHPHEARLADQTAYDEMARLARHPKLPIVIHCRPSDNNDNAWDDCLRLIHDQWAPHGIGGILHCFTGNWPQAKSALDMGFMISFAGNITFPKAQQIRDAALEVPLDRMLIETDCPYLAPIPHRGKRNEPAFVKETARKIGELRNRSMEEVGDQTARNFYNFFKISEIAESKVPAR
jgi:TatD DNase family protein